MPAERRKIPTEGAGEPAVFCAHAHTPHPTQCGPARPHLGRNATASPACWRVWRPEDWDLPGPTQGAGGTGRTMWKALEAEVVALVR